MAVEFHSVANDCDCLYLTEGVVTDPPCTIVASFNTAVPVTTSQTIAKVGYYNDRGGLGLHISSGNVVSAISTFAHLSGSAGSADSFTVGNWHHAAARFTLVGGQTKQQAFLDGVPGSLAGGLVGTQSPFVMDRTAIGWDPFVIPFAGGLTNACLAHVAIWNAALTDAEIEDLAAGVLLPTDIQAANLVFYAPLTDAPSATTNIAGARLTLHENSTGIAICVDGPENPEPIETGEPDECGSEDEADDLATAIDWPKCVLVPASINVEVVSQTVSPGRSFTGIEQIIQPDAGFWRITYSGIPIRNKAHALQWRETESALNGRNNPVMVPLYEAKLSSTPVVAVVVDDKPIGAAAGITLFQSAGETITAGMHFQAGDYAYRIKRVVDEDDGLTTVTIFPPLRQAISADDVLDFNDPHCRCRLERDDGMDVNLELLRFASPSVSFVEDV